MEGRDEEIFKKLKIWFRKTLISKLVFISKKDALIQINLDEIPKVCERLINIYMKNGGRMIEALELKAEIAQLINNMSTFGARTSRPIDMYELEYHPPAQIPVINDGQV